MIHQNSFELALSYNSYHIWRKPCSSSDMAAGNEQRAWLEQHRFTSQNSNNFRLSGRGRSESRGPAGLGLGNAARVLQEPAAAADSESESPADSDRDSEPESPVRPGRAGGGRTTATAAPAAGAAATIRTSRCLTPQLMTLLMILISIKVKLWQQIPHNIS